jgi:hypothetical protein
MNVGKTIFAQLMEFVPWTSVTRIVDRYGGNAGIRRLSCAEQFRAMAFAQLTSRESLRDLVTTLAAHPNKRYGLGFRHPVQRSTLADANETRDWRIWADVAAVLIKQARKLYCDIDLGLDINDAVYALDATTIDLCLSLFDWAHFRRAKGAVKLHTLLDLRGNIPAFIHVSDGKMHEVNVLDFLPTEPGAFYVMDRGYLDFERLHTLSQTGAFFVIRAKHNTQLRRIYSKPNNRQAGVICDQTVVFTGYAAQRHYPSQLRRVRFKDPETGKTFVFLTNNFMLPPLTIAALYKNRWQVELFFKWIKQHLRIKKFMGNSENAVKTQIWIAVSTYVLIAIVKKKLQIEPSLYTLLQILSVSVFEKTQLSCAFAAGAELENEDGIYKQLNLFEN